MSQDFLDKQYCSSTMFSPSQNRSYFGTMRTGGVVLGGYGCTPPLWPPSPFSPFWEIIVYSTYSRIFILAHVEDELKLTALERIDLTT